jgi:hypothetical protein
VVEGIVHFNRKEVMNKSTLNKLKPFLYGKMLGDANLERPTKLLKKSRLKLEHSIKQKEYILHCYNKMHNFFNKPFDRERKLLYKGSVRHYKTSILQSKRLDVFTDMYNDWYKDIKSLPGDLFEYFTAETLAYWYMDDGYIHFKTRSIDICFCTNGFSEKDVDTLVSILNSKFDLQASKSPSKGRFIIRIGHKDKILKFKELVKPYIIDSMVYKIRDCK